MGMRILVIDNGTRFLKQLRRLLHDHTVRVVARNRISSPVLRWADAVILSGGHLFSVMGHERQYARELAIIQHCPKPIIGICLGFELIAHAFGAKLVRMRRKERGVLQLRFLRSDPVFRALPTARVFESHRWVVGQVVSPLVALAWSRDGVEAIKHRRLPLYGFQFHPEMFTNQLVGDEIFRNVLRILSRKL